MSEVRHERDTAVVRDGYARTYDRPNWFGNLSWGAIIASVVAGLGITLLLVTFGAAAGLEAAEGDADAGRIATGVGTWAVISALLGTIAGTFIGGRFSHWQSPGSTVYHGITSWGLTTLLGVWLGATGALGLLGSALGREDLGAGTAEGAGGDAAEAAEAALSEISWGGWALAFGMLLTLLAAIGGWWLGSRTSISDAEGDGPERTARPRDDRPNTLTGT